MTPEERAAKAVDVGVDVGNEFGVSGDGDRHLKGVIADAIRAAELAAVERCARVVAFVLEHEPHNAAALPHLLRTRPEMDVYDLSGPPKDLNFPAGFVIGGES